MSIEEAAEKALHLAQDQADNDKELDAYIAAVKRAGGPDLSRNEMHRILFSERRAAAVKASAEREAQAVEILRRLPARQSRNEPAWLQWKDWTRDDFIRAITWDQASGGRGGKVAIAHRCLSNPSSIYRQWQTVAPGEPWPAGNKGPSGP